MYKCIQTHDFASFQHTDAFLLTFPSCSRRRTSMRKEGFRPTPGGHCPLSVVDCQERRLSIDRRRGVLTKCQTKASTVPFLAPKYDWVDSEALLRQFAKYTLTQIRSKRYHPDTT